MRKLNQNLSKTNSTTSNINTLQQKKSSYKSITSNFSNICDVLSSNKFYQNKKIISKLLDVLKMRLFLENIQYDNEDEITNLIKNNLDLIDLQHIELNSMNKFVDDLIEIMKDTKRKSEEEYRDIQREDFRFNTINFLKKEYRPRATSDDKFRKRRTMEIALEKPKGVNRGPMYFQMLDRNKRSEAVFYKDGEEIESKKKFPKEMEDIQMKMINDIASKKSSKK